MAGGRPSRFGLTPDGRGVRRRRAGPPAGAAGGRCARRRVVPAARCRQHWAGAYACWGLENREAALRMVTGSTGQRRRRRPTSRSSASTCTPTPTSLLAGLLAAGSPASRRARPARPGRRRPGRAAGGRARARAASSGCPTSLREAVDAFAGDAVIREAFGGPLSSLDRRRARERDRAVRRRGRRGGRRRTRWQR